MIVLLLLLRLAVIIQGPGRSEGRNVVLFVGDDAGFENSAYNNTVIRTPGIQWLADHGTTFMNAFTAVSSCSPSRASILTGLPPHQNGMYGLHQAEHNFQSFAKVQSISRILQKHKIYTGIIGKKHVGPGEVYPFDFAQTEENNSVLQVGRNITKMKELVAQFLDLAGKRSFFLYIGFHDPHRCGHTNPEFGNFCELFGNGQPGMGTIPDWTPNYYDPNSVIVPYFIPQTPAARSDIAAQYTSVNRMDQGIELMLEELRSRSLLESTLLLFTSDNGIPFPSGRTNLYDPGMKEPFIIVNPYSKGGVTDTDHLVSLLDIVPTVLDWFQLQYPKYKIFRNRVQLQGQSLLPLVSHGGRFRKRRKRQRFDGVFSSHSLHEITMYYPMRVVRSRRFKLIHNLNFRMPFPIDQDFYISPTFQDLLNRTEQKQPTLWYKEIKGYYYRPQWELYDVIDDEEELRNLVDDVHYQDIFERLQRRLFGWMNATDDPWLCSPSGVLENSGAFRTQPQCMPLYNDV